MVNACALHRSIRQSLKILSFKTEGSVIHGIHIIRFTIIAQGLGLDKNVSYVQAPISAFKHTIIIAPLILSTNRCICPPASSTLHNPKPSATRCHQVSSLEHRCHSNSNRTNNGHLARNRKSFVSPVTPVPLPKSSVAKNGLDAKDAMRTI